MNSASSILGECPVCSLLKDGKRCLQSAVVLPQIPDALAYLRALLMMVAFLLLFLWMIWRGPGDR
jgi:hypothetical protein